MSKSKKKTPQIDPRVLTRPRLDALFDRHARGELDLDGLLAGGQALLVEAGHRPVLDALVKRMEGTPEAERESLMLLVEHLRSAEVIASLWQQVKKPGALSLEAKTTALVILKQMGEAVDLADPGRYFSPRDFKPGDIKSAENLFRLGLRGMARHLRAARNAVELERMTLDINRMPENATDGEGVLLHLIEEAEAEANDLGADFLYALAHASPFSKVQKLAEAALTRLAASGVQPVTPVILGLGQDKFHAAYMTDPDHPWQQSVNVAWERAGGVIQALVFLLDFGVPWAGALKDLFATQPLTPDQYRREFVEQAAEKMGARVYRVSLARAQATIAAALEANHQNKIRLPKEFNEFRHLVERWVLYPPARVLETDTTRDELGDRPLVPDRSRQPLMVDLRGAKGRETLKLLSQYAEEGVVTDEFENVPWRDAQAFEDFDKVLQDVAATYADMEGRTWWEVDWVRNYLSSLHPKPGKLKRSDPALAEIVDRWRLLCDCLDYLDAYGYDIHQAADLRGFHFSEYLADEALEGDDDGGRRRLETIRDFFDFLARQGPLPADTPCLAALAQMLAQPDEIALLERPEALGGEIAVWLREFGEDEEDQPLTYNEWWTALVLEKKFKGNRDKFRREARGKPDAQAKLALLDRLQSRLASDPEYLDSLSDDRPPEPDNYQRAQEWFERERVSEARAW